MSRYQKILTMINKLFSNTQGASLEEMNLLLSMLSHEYAIKVHEEEEKKKQK